MNNSLEKRLPISLLGNSDENFYQLGLKHRKTFPESYKGLINIFGPMPKGVNPLVSLGVKQLIKKVLDHRAQLSCDMKHYAQGLEVTTEQAASVFLIPELLSCIDKFMPNLYAPLLGCSSLIYRQDDNLHHLRILDFPLVNIFDKFSEEVLFKFKSQKVFFHSCSGLAYPAISAMNESGITVTLHQKYSRFFDLKGVPVFEIIKLIMEHSTCIKDITDILDEHPSISSWGLIISTGSSAYEIDLHGSKYYLNEYPLENDNWKYICNKSISNHNDFQNVLPYGIDNYNSMRSESIHTYLEKTEKNRKLTEADYLKAMSSPLGHAKKVHNWKLSPLTCATVDTVLLSPSTNRTLKHLGPAPITENHPILEITNCFGRPSINITSPKNKKSDYYKGLYHLGQCTYHFQNGHQQELFHHIQCCLLQWQGMIEFEIAKLYHCAYAIRFEKDKKEIGIILNELEELSQLPEYLNDHKLILISRLQGVLSIPRINRIADIKNKNLRKYYLEEFEAPKKIIEFKNISLLPRPEIMDIIYPFHAIDSNS